MTMEQMQKFGKYLMIIATELFFLEKKTPCNTQNYVMSSKYAVKTSISGPDNDVTGNVTTFWIGLMVNEIIPFNGHCDDIERLRATRG